MERVRPNSGTTERLRSQVLRPSRGCGEVPEPLRLLIVVPTLSRQDPSALGKTDMWRFTPVGLERVLAETCSGGDIDVRGYGNLRVAVAFLMGLAAEDLTKHEVRFTDPRFRFWRADASPSRSPRQMRRGEIYVVDVNKTLGGLRVLGEEELRAVDERMAAAFYGLISRHHEGSDGR